MGKDKKSPLRIKREYLKRLREAKGLSVASVDKAASAIDLYLDWLGRGDLGAFHSEKAIAFKRHLARQTTSRGKPLAVSTINGILRDLRSFFSWLAEQRGYRSRLAPSDADWFSPDKKSERARRGELWKPHASAKQVAHAIRCMPYGTALERRDRALMAFCFLTAAREKTVMTVRMAHVDLTNRCAHFDGKLVDTKFGKRFTVKFFPVGDEFEKILRDWITELRENYLWGPTDPVFPKTDVVVGPNGGFCCGDLLREPWRSPARMVKIFKQSYEAAGLPPFGPHSIRRTIMSLGNTHCRTIEQLQAWSQNLGHDDLTTSLTYYGAVALGRQMELIERMWENLGGESPIE